MKVELVRITEDPVEAIELAASNCYDSEPMEGKIMNSCYKSGHHSVLEFAEFHFHIEGVSRACYDKDTEILTSAGWKLFKDIRENEEVLTYSKETGMSEFQQILNKTEYKYNGQMHKYKSQNVDLFITPNHNLLMKKYDVDTPQDYALMPSDCIKINRFYTTKHVLYDNPVGENIIIKGFSYTRKNNQSIDYEKTTEDLKLNRELFYKFLAWYISDGSTVYDKNENKYVISICQTKCKINIEKESRERIFDIIKKLGFNPHYEEKCIKFNSITLGKYLKDIGVSYDKAIPLDMFKDFNKEYAKVFLDEYVLGDGTVEANGHERLYTTSKSLSDQLQLITFIAGYSSKIWIDDRIGLVRKIGSKIFTNKHVLYIISLSKGKRNNTPIIKKDQHFSTEFYNDMVYCVEVPNHTLFIRRNGICLWCGNCTHQLVRSRLASFAQRSQRYVKEHNFDYIIPQSIQNNEEALYIYYKCIENIGSAYGSLIKLDIPAEDARFVLPNACETIIDMKVNLRELMHFMNERLCTCAQWEIRELAIKMKQLVAQKEPKFNKYLVPKCERNYPFMFCTEDKKRCCGRHRHISEVFNTIEED